MISIILNFGIGKSTTISANNYPIKKKEISFKSIIYTINIALIFFFFSILIIFTKITF